MASDYAGKSSFWTTITRLVLGDMVTPEQLYNNGILKLADRTAWLRDEITRRTAALMRTSAGTAAIITASVDLSTLVYDATAGALNGQSFICQSDNSGGKTVTFGAGGTAPLSPADVVSQVNAATSSNPLASVDSAGHLSLASVTTGGSATVAAVSGAALAILGFTNGQTASGVATGADGISQVGGAAVGSIPTGTLRSMLKYLTDSTGAGSLGIDAYAGAMWVISEGTIRTFLRSLADKAPRLDAGLNAFTGAVSAAILKASSSWVTSFTARSDVQIGSTVTAYTVDFTVAAAPLYEARAWAGAGGNLTITLAAFAGYTPAVGNPEIEIVFAPAVSGAICLIQNAATDALVYFSGPDRCTMRWNGAAWVRVNGGHLAA